MIKSMTGYGKTTCELTDKKVHVEIKSLNSKQLDLNMRLPSIYKDKEFELRNLLSNELQRGKVDLIITVETVVSEKIPQINEQAFEHYYLRLSQLSGKLGIEGQTDYIRTILSLPETLKIEQSEPDEQEWSSVKSSVLDAVGLFNQFRCQEGTAIFNDIQARVNKIAELSSQVEQYEKPRIERIKSRIKEELDNLKDKSIDNNRFEQELIYYLEKLDITEEKVRLKNHIEYFSASATENEPVGKKLAFITQEIGREINTMGSKANDADIQKLVIQMKDELEKIKEQLLNIM
ncbi:MAG TPA: YicC family protein [Marinilabiliaceae bacterium]|nr:YicC family protein [Marinilabiliaceae bacterium]